MNARELVKENFIKENGYPNAKIIDYRDPQYFDFYRIDELPQNLALADSVIKDENGELLYGFAKNFDGEEMRLITGYTGSGKSTRYLLQQLRVAVYKGQSAVVTDISGQLIEYSYDMLKEMGVNVLVLNFADSKSSNTFNPFYIEAKKCKDTGKITETTVEFIEYISQQIISIETTDPTWSMGARGMIKGLIYGMFEELVAGQISEEEITLYNLLQQFYWLRDRTVKEASACDISEFDYYKYKDRYSRSVQLISTIVENATNTRASYFGVINDCLSEINNSIMFELTSTNSICLSDLWEKQTVIFINTGGKISGDILTGIFVHQLYQQALDVSSKKLSKKLDRPIQIFLDEFANVSFGDIKHFEKMLTTTRKMQIFFNMFIQNYTQIKTKFGEYGASTITSNSTEIFMGTKDFASREEFARSCGNRTIESLDSIYRGGEPHLVSIPLITPEELLKVQKGKMYMARNGYDMIETYFEAAYNCKEFSQSFNYKNDFEGPKYDYEKHVLVQPLMVEKRKPSDWTADLIDKLLTEGELDLLSTYVKPNLDDDIFTLKKYERMGLLRKNRNGLYVLAVKKSLINGDTRLDRKPFDWDF